MTVKHTFTMEEIKELLDSAAQTKRLNEEIFEIKSELRQIKMILMQAFKITSI